jgi:hypothetical protein
MIQKFADINICSDSVNRRMIFICYPQIFIQCVKSRSCHIKTQDLAHSFIDIWWASSAVLGGGVCWNHDKNRLNKLTFSVLLQDHRQFNITTFTSFHASWLMVDGAIHSMFQVTSEKVAPHVIFSFWSASSNFYRNCISSCTNDCESGMSSCLDIHLLISCGKYIKWIVETW